MNIQAYWWNDKIHDTHITGLVNVFRWGWIQYKVHINKANQGFESCDRPIVWKRPIWVKIGGFVSCDLEIWWMTLENNRASLLRCFKLCATFHSHRSNWSYSPETPNLGQIRQFLELCDLEIWRITLKNNRSPLPCYFKLYASFRSHR